MTSKDQVSQTKYESYLIIVLLSSKHSRHEWRDSLSPSANHGPCLRLTFRNNFRFLPHPSMVFLF